MKYLILILLLLMVVPGCKNDKQPTIPYVYVDLLLYPDSMDYIEVGGYKYINAGYRGIVIYRFLNDQFMVYERCCPYDPEKSTARITVDPSGTTCIDSTCMSKYLLYDGSPSGGPSSYILMTYRYTYDGQRLHIFN